MKAFHEAGGRYVLVKETAPNVFDSIAENLTKADAERIVAIEQAATDALESLKRLADVEGAYRVSCIAQLEKALKT